MDYVIRRNPHELDSTGYIEIGPGRYAGKHWQEGFLFVWEDSFGMAEGILTRHMPAYDHFGMNDIPRPVGQAIIANWREVASVLPALTPAEAYQALNLDASFRILPEEEMLFHRREIAGLLQSVAEACELFYRTEEWICVLGM